MSYRVTWSLEDGTFETEEFNSSPPAKGDVVEYEVGVLRSKQAIRVEEIAEPEVEPEPTPGSDQVAAANDPNEEDDASNVADPQPENPESTTTSDTVTVDPPVEPGA